MTHRTWGLLALILSSCVVGPEADGASDGLGIGDLPVSRPDGVCGLSLRATIRDFEASHPDFERAIGSRKNLVEARLGSDGKPVYAPHGATAVTAGEASFEQWYRDIPGVNQRFSVDLPLTVQAGGSVVFDDNAFFPIDGQGFGDTRINNTLSHNYHFTTEIHSVFRYVGGEQFTFRGDDDVWVFVNGYLVIDLGGVHAPEAATVSFDAVAKKAGLIIGQEYSLDVFHAERHTTQSSFRFETSACFKPDADGDGVTSDHDCNDNDPNVGGLLYASSFDGDDGGYAPGPKLADPWVPTGGALSNTRGGQQALLGSERWGNTVTYARVRAHGLERKCRNCGYRGLAPEGNSAVAPLLLPAVADGGSLELGFEEDMVFRLEKDEALGAVYGTATDQHGQRFAVSFMFSARPRTETSGWDVLDLVEGTVRASDGSIFVTLDPGAVLEVGSGANRLNDNFGGSMAFSYWDGQQRREAGTLVFDAGERDRFRIGILARAEADADQDEGFHGYRCALARNSLVDCVRPGRFVQLASFIDGVEDDLKSECDRDCPVNTTFDELERVERSTRTDVLRGDAAELAFWVVDDALQCEFTGSDGERVTARATDTHFSEGRSGISVLNALADYEEVVICEAFAVPDR